MDAVEVRSDIPYKGVDGTELKMDIYRPPASSPNARAPGVVLIHGGPLEETYRPD